MKNNFTPQKCYNLWRKKDNVGIISNYKKIFNLNETAFDIWQWINGKNTIGDIINKLIENYSITYEDAKKDSYKIFQFLHENNLAIADYEPLFKLGKTNNKLCCSNIDDYCVTNSNNDEIDILIITPPSPKFESNILDKNYNLFPLGIGYLLSSLSNDTSIKYCYINLWNKILTEQQLNSFIIKKKFKILGISCMTENYLNGIRLIKHIKNIYNDPFITIAGGPHITLCYKEILKQKIIDICFIGESELSILKFVNNVVNNRNIYNIEGTAFLDNNENILLNEGIQIKDIDKLNFPIINEQAYIKNDFSTISGSRGCPSHCKFCAAGILSGNKYRFRTISNILEEIKIHYKNGIRKFAFIDDTITIIPSRISEFCDLLKENKINILWNAESRVDFAANNLNLLKKMHSAGCRALQLGIEAGTDQKLIELKKGISIEQIKRALDNAKRANISIAGSMVVGIPNETLESIIQTFDFALELQKHYPVNIIVGWFIPYPGTKYREELIECSDKLFNLYDYDEFTTLHPNYKIFNEVFFNFQSLYFDYMIKIMGNNKDLLKKVDLNTRIFENKNDYI